MLGDPKLRGLVSGTELPRLGLSERNTGLGVFVEEGYTILVVALAPSTSLLFVQVHPFIINPSLQLQ